MSRMRSMVLPALLALGGLGLWGSSAAAQYVGGGTAFAPGYRYAPGHYYAPRPAPGLYYYAAPAPYYVAPARSVRSSVLVPVGASARNYPAAPGPLHHFGLEPESLPAQIAEDIAPAPTTPRPGPTWRASWWQGRTWRRTWRRW